MNLTPNPVPEHAPLPKKKPEPKGDGEGLPGADEAKLVAKVEGLLQESKTWRAQHDQYWISDYQRFRGHQWQKQRPSYRHSIVVNLIAQNIQSTAPLLVDSQPRVEFVPENPEDMPIAEILNELSEHDWVRENWLEVLIECVYDKNIMGTAFGRMEPCENANSGMVHIDFESVDPVYVYPSPGARNIDKKCRYFITAIPTPVEEIWKSFPGSKKKGVKADGSSFTKSSSSMMETRYSGNSAQFQDMRDPRLAYRDGSGAPDTGRGEALLIRCWILDEETMGEEELKQQEQALTWYGSSQQKYPFGREIVTCCGRILRDRPNPYDHGKFPYARYIHYIDPRNIFGISQIENQRGPQEAFNKLVSFALDYLVLMGNPIWVIDSTAMVDEENLFNRPGSVVKKTPGSEVRREQGVPLQPYVLQLIDRLKEWFEQSAGDQDLTRITQGVTAASAIARLQESAQTRIRLQGKFQDMFVHDLGVLYKGLVLQYYSAPRVYRITGKDGVDKWFKFYIESTDDGKRFAVYQPYVQQMQPNSSPVPSPDIRRQELIGDFDVRVSTGTTLPFARAERKQEQRQLYLDKAISLKEYLKSIDYPNYQNVILDREKEEQAAANAAQAQQQAQQQAAAAAKQAAQAGG